MRNYTTPTAEDSTQNILLSAAKPLCSKATRSLRHTAANDPELLAKTAEEKIQMLTGNELENSRESLKDEVLPSFLHGHVGILCSPGGYGKSGLALLIANQIASGGKKDLLGFGSVAGGAAVILTLEDPVEVYAARQREIVEDFSDDERNLVRKNLHLIKGLCVQNAVDAQEIINLIEEKFKQHGCDISSLRLLVIDHLSYWSAADLNDARTAQLLMTEFRKLARELNCAILLLHHSNRSAMQQGKYKQRGGATVGGHYRFHALARWMGMIEDDEKDDKSRKILAVSKANHGKTFTLALRHRDDRGGLLYRHDFVTNNNAGDNIEDKAIAPKVEEVENFNLGEASAKLQTIDDNTHHIMNWLSRNPAFETVSTNRRKKLTYVDQDGEEKDRDRPTASFFRDVWVHGDSLQINGPVCDQDDMKLYALLVNELTKLHQEGARGLILEISLRNILRLAGLEKTGPNCNRIHRQLDRLRRMALDFKNSRGHRWKGPLINDVLTVGEGRNCKVRIGFNHFMVTFYKIQEYTMFKKSIAKSLKGDSLSFYIFYASQNSATMKISIEKCKKLLGIAPDFDKKEARKKIKKSIEDLIAAGVMDPAKTFIRGGNVHTCRI